MPEPTEENAFDAVLMEYWQANEAGAPVDPAAFAARHPEYAQELAEFFADQKALERIVEPFALPAHRISGLGSGSGSRSWGGRGKPLSAASTQGGGRIFGNYELLEEIARGGMGVVFKARQLDLGRIVALKMILAGRLASAEDVRRFEIEAENAAKLDHPNIVPIYELGTSEGQPYFTMKLLEGGNLAQHIARLAGDARKAVKIMALVANAVHHAHQRGVLHRDLKPSNILLDQNDVPLVTDFGLARPLHVESSLTVVGAVVGTPKYMAPEQADSNSTLTTATDVYALGAILYELLIGRPVNPCNVSSDQSTVSPMANRLHMKHMKPRRLDRDLDTVCRKCLEHVPGHRYASAAELAEDLERWLAGEPVLARPVHAPTRIWRWCKRSPLVASLAAAVFLLLVLVAVGSSIAAYRFASSAKQQKVLSRIAEERLAQSQIFAADGLARSRRFPEARSMYYESLQLARSLKISEVPAQAGLLTSFALGPPPLQGVDGAFGTTGGFEWPAPQVPIGDRRMTACVLLPSGRLALVACEDHTIKLWDTTTGLLIRTFAGHAQSVESLAISKDGTTAVSGSRDKTFRVWDVDSGRCTFASLPQPQTVRTIALSADGRVAVIGCENEAIHVWDLTAQQQRHTMGAPSLLLYSLGISPDAMTAVTGGSDGFVRVWDVNAGTQTSATDCKSGRIRGVTMSDDGRTALLSCDTVIYFDVINQKILRPFTGHTSIVWDAGFLTDGRTAVSVSTDRTMRKWELESGRELATFGGHDELIRSVAVSRDGRVALTAGAEPTLRLWPLAADQDIRVFEGHTADVRDAVFSPDGRLALSGGHDNVMILWDVGTGQTIRRFTGHANAVTGARLTPDGRRAVSSSDDGTLGVWDLTTGQRLCSMERHSKFVSCMALSADGRRAVSGGDEGAAKLWDVATGRQILTFGGHDYGAIRCVAFSPDGNSVLTAGDDQTVRQWSAQNGKPLQVLRGHQHVVWSVAFSPDGRSALSGSADKQIKLWDLATGKEIRSFIGHNYFVSAVAFSPDGTLALSGSWDRTVRLWDIASGKEMWNSTVHSDVITSVAFSGDGRRALSSSRDGTVRIYDFDRPDEYQRLGAALPPARAALQQRLDDPSALAAFGRWYAFRGMTQWGLDFLMRARAAGAEVSDLELARCHWVLGNKELAHAEFTRARQRFEAPDEYLDLCLQATR